MSTTIRDQIQQGLDARTDGPDLRVVAPSPETPWMTDQQVAAYTGFTRGALATMRYEHRGPAYSKPNGKIRYRRDHVDEWMAEGLQRPAKRRRA